MMVSLEFVKDIDKIKLIKTSVLIFIITFIHLTFIHLTFIYLTWLSEEFEVLQIWVIGSNVLGKLRLKVTVK